MDTHQKLIRAAESNAKFFGEKSHEVSVPGFDAFGIQLLSRHGKAYEISQMLDFCILAAEECVNQHVHSLFYDSNADTCEFILKDGTEKQPEVMQKLRAIAMHCLEQFEWEGTSYLGRRGDEDTHQGA